MKYLAILLILIPIFAFAQGYKDKTCDNQCPKNQACTYSTDDGKYYCLISATDKSTKYPGPDPSAGYTDRTCNNKCSLAETCVLDRGTGKYGCVQKNGYTNKNCNNECAKNETCAMDMQTGTYYCAAELPGPNPSRYPMQDELSFKGYALLSAFAILIFVSLTISEKYIRREKDIRMGFPSIIFVSSLIPTVVLMITETYIKTQFYMYDGIAVRPLSYFLLVATLAIGIYTFIFSTIWSCYKLKSMGEITPYMWSLIRLANAVKKFTNI